MGNYPGYIFSSAYQYMESVCGRYANYCSYANHDWNGAHASYGSHDVRTVTRMRTVGGAEAS